MNPKTFSMISLGCAKNTVDSDSMAQLLVQDGYQFVSSPRRASVLIVNTCGFIGTAREESYSELRRLAEAKRPGQLLIAAGCLTQRYGLEVARRVPGVDGILGTRRWMDIVGVVRELRKGPHPEPLYHLPETTHLLDENDPGHGAAGQAFRSQRLPEDCGWLPPDLCVLRHPAHQRQLQSAARRK